MTEYHHQPLLPPESDQSGLDDGGYKSTSSPEDDSTFEQAEEQIPPHHHVQPHRMSLAQRVKNAKAGFTEFTEFSKRLSTLNKCLAIIFFYLLVGAFAFSLFFERWTFIDSLYFGVVTFTTCGFGDLSPDGSAEMIFAIFFILIGIAVLATVAFGIVFENMFDAYDGVIQKARESTGQDFMAKFSPHDSSLKRRLDRFLVNDVLVELISVLPLLAVMLLGTLFMGYIEGWGTIRSIYFLVVASTSVGYGDVTPVTQEMKAFCVLFIPFSVGVTAEIFSRITGVFVSHAAERAEQEFLNRRLTEGDLDEMDDNHDGVVTEMEFMKFMLVTMGKVDRGDWDKLQNVFKKLDATNDRVLTTEDLRVMANRKH